MTKRIVPGILNIFRSFPLRKSNLLVIPCRTGLSVIGSHAVRRFSGRQMVPGSSEPVVASS